YSTDNTFTTGVTSVTGIASGTLASAVTGLSPLTTYYYRVKAVNAGGSSIYSASTSIRTLANPPTSPATALTATAISASQINLNWTAATFPGGVQTGYIILRRQDGTNPTATGVNNGVAPGSLPLTAGTTLASNVTSGATVSFNNTGLTINTQYNYIIIPYTWDGVNASSYNYLTTGFPNANATTAVADPTLTATTSSSTQINLSSTANAAGNNIVVVFNTTGTFTTPTNGTAPGTVGAALAGGTITYKGAAAGFTNHTGRTPNTLYYYKAFSYDAGNNYSIGVTASATTISNPPVAAAATLPLNNGFTANWTAPTGNGPAAFTYTLEYSTDNTFATGVTSVAAIASGTLANAVTGLSPLTTYYYRVKVVNAGGSSTYSASTSIRTLANPPTSPATALTATSISASQINL